MLFKQIIDKEALAVDARHEIGLEHLELNLNQCESKIYRNPPTTTDFAIIYVPTEGLYAELASSYQRSQVLKNY